MCEPSTAESAAKPTRVWVRREVFGERVVVMAQSDLNES
jgi:hypothetical protein